MKTKVSTLAMSVTLMTISVLNFFPQNAIGGIPGPGSGGKGASFACIKNGSVSVCCDCQSSSSSCSC